MIPLVPVAVLESLAQGLHATGLGVAAAAPAAHVALVALEPAALVGRLLDARGVHQMEGALVLVVEVGVLAARAEQRRVFICGGDG